MRPQLEYTASVWDPYTEINKKKIKEVKKMKDRLKYIITKEKTQMISSKEKKLKIRLLKELKSS